MPSPITHLSFDSVREKPLAEIWKTSKSFKAFRDLEWMEEPCRSCARKALDWCRCQAFAFSGQAEATDPACFLSPLHGDLVSLASEESAAPPPPLAYRRIESKALH
jgi:pyrroloquinoline quinone biosynthesis protein E